MGAPAVQMGAGHITVDGGSGYKDWPAACTDGSSIHLVYREGADYHATFSGAGAGVLRYRRLAADGSTTYGPVTIHDPVDDVQYPAIIRLVHGGHVGRLVVAFARSTNSDDIGRTLWLMHSDDGGATWSTPTQITTHGWSTSGSNAQPIATSFAERADGTVLLFTSGKLGVSTFYSSNAMTSADDGASFGSPVVIANGGSDGRHYTFPWAVLQQSGRVLVLIGSRPGMGPDGIFRTYSDDSGATWSTPTNVLNESWIAAVEWFPDAILAFATNSAVHGFVSTSLDGGVSWATLTDLDPAATSPMLRFAPVFVTPTTGVVVWSEEVSPSQANLLLRTFTVPADPTAAIPVGWDVYARDDLNGPILETLVNCESRTIRIELDGSGKGEITINRHAAEATASILAKGNLVKVRIPELGDDYVFAWFLEDGDFELLAKGEEGAEVLHFSGRGALAYLDRARMWSTAFTTGLDISDTWKKIWQTGKVSNPVGIAVDPADSTYVWIIREDTCRIYKVRQSDLAVVSISPALFSGLASGLALDPSDATIFWALEAPWLSGSSSHTKIHKIRRSDYANLATFDLGSAIKHTDIRAGGTYLWLSRYDGTTSVYKRSKADGSVVNSYTIAYGGVNQTKLNGISVNGTKLAYWFEGTKRALLATEAAPTTITGKISTVSISSFGGEWTTESSQDYFYMVSSSVDQTWKYQVTTATPHDPVDGTWRLDEGTPGAILARLMAEWQAAGRPQQPIPTATYAFDFTDDSHGSPWATNDGTLQFTAAVGDLGMSTVLRLVPYGITVQMSPGLVLGGYNAFGTDRSSGTFGAGKVRLVAGTNIGEELKRRLDSRRVDSHMLAKGSGTLYATSTDDDLGYVQEGFVSTDLSDATALAGTAAAELARERSLSDAIAFVVEWGDDELAGLYMPWIHYWVGDTVRVHTGSGPFDYDETNWTVYAITLEEQENGTWRSIAELGAGLLSSATAAGSGAGGTSAGGSTGTGSTSTPVTLTDTVTGDSYKGTTIESASFGLSQPSPGVIDVVVRPPTTDATIEVQENGADVVSAASGLDAGHGLDATDEGGGIAGLAVDETELTYGSAGSIAAEAFGSAAAAGAVGYPADAGHRHAMPTPAVTTSGLTQSTGKLLGRTTAGTGAIEEITPGAGLTLAAGTLTAAAAAGADVKGNEISPPLSIPVPPWVKPSGSGLITADAQGRISIDTGAGYKSFPGMCYLAGRLHLVYRQGTDHVTSADGAIKYRYSDDLGRTWSAAVSIASGAGDDMRDPSIVALSSGRLLVGFDQVSGGYQIKVIYSDNRGQTWSPTYIVPASGLAYEVAGTSQMLELRDGTVILPAFGKNLAGDHYKALLFKSTDGGLTFGSQTDITTGASDRVEPQIRLVASGDLVCLYHDLLTQNVYRRTSTDGGTTWGAEATVNTELGGGRTDFIEFFPSALFLIGRKTNAGSENYWAVSWDEGATWTASQIVDGATDVNMYAAPVLLAAGYWAVVYSVENSFTDADLYLRYYHDGYGTDPLGQAFLAALSNAGSTAVTGVISPAQLTANTDNWAPAGLSAATVIRVSTDASRNLTGLTGGTSGRLVILANVGAQDLVLKHDATSTAANRFYCPNDTDLTVSKDSTVLLEYDATSSRWRVIGGSAAALTLGTSAQNVAAAGASSAGGSASTASKSDHSHALTYHDEPLTDGNSNFIFYSGDVIAVLGVPN